MVEKVSRRDFLLGFAKVGASAAALAMLGSCGSTTGAPTDNYFRNVYPGIDGTFNLGSPALRWGSVNTKALIVQESIGIGTPTPTYPLDVVGAGRVSGGVVVTTPDKAHQYLISVDNAGNIISTLQ